MSSRFRYLTDASYSRYGKDSGKEMKQVAYVPPCPDWYGDREWNVNLFGTYAFTNTEFAPNPSLIDIVQSTSEGGPVLGTYDRYIGGDHAWGGGGAAAAGRGGAGRSAARCAAAPGARRWPRCWPG